MINTRLFEWYGIDTKKNLGIANRCPKPFDTVLIDSKGSCYLCECTAWLPQSTGNLHLQDLGTILKSHTATLLRESILDQSYRYCNDKQCSYLLDARNDSVPFKSGTPRTQIRNIRLAIDNSCNLSCPSCRTKIIFEKDKRNLKKRYRLADKIIEYIKSQEQVINVHVGSDGDPFASLVYRYFIRHAKDLTNTRFTIQTNGLLIKKMYQRHRPLFEKLDVLNISIDGATKKTYELLRRGGSFFKIMENLHAVRQLKKKHGFKLILHFVVQKENYQDMIPMIDLADQHDVDRLWFNRITDWNTYQDFSKVDVLDHKNQNHKEFLKEIVKVRDKKSNVVVEMPTIINKNYETISHTIL